MRQSTKNLRKTIASTFTGTASVPRPKPEDLNPDGSFLLHSLVGQDLEGNSLNPTNKISRKPITPPPGSWFADFNQDDAPNTLRIYRYEHGQAVDVCKYSFNPQAGTWNPPELDTSSHHNANTTYSQHSSLSQFVKTLFTLPLLLITKPLTLFAPLIRLLLWPIADFRWQDKIAHREKQLRLEFIEELNMNRDGYHVTYDGIQLRADGTASFRDKLLKPGKPQIIPSSSLRGQETVWAEWKNNQLTIHSGARVYSYEFGSWYQMRIHEPTFRDSLYADYFATKTFGYNVLIKFFIIWFILVILFAIYGFYVQSRDWNSTSLPPTTTSNSSLVATVNQSPFPFESSSP